MSHHFRVGIFIIGLVLAPTASHSQDPAEQAFMDAKMKMRETMPIDYMGGADLEFVRSIISHHQGAIELAEVELRYGKDAEARAFAEEIISAQKADIDRLSAWLSQHKE